MPTPRDAFNELMVKAAIDSAKLMVMYNNGTQLSYIVLKPENWKIICEQIQRYFDNPQTEDGKKEK